MKDESGIVESDIDQPGPIRAGEQLDGGRLESYLLQRIPGIQGPLVVKQFPRGFSNLTYLIEMGGQQFVLRRPPFGNRVQSAHDMSREYRVLSRLCEVYHPAPRPLVFCDDPQVIGDSFYVMERRHGVVLRDDFVPRVLRNDPTTVAQLCESFIDNLALLHQLDYRAAGLGDLGRPQGYVERQVVGWSRRYQDAKTDDFKQLEQLAVWLTGNLPVDGRPGLIHNDYKYDNLLLNPDDVTRISAVFDWEMATVGDPLMDLGATLAYWIEASDPSEHRQWSFGPTTLAGSYTRRQLAERYARQTGRDLSDIRFYYCFGLFKLAVIVQQIYVRYVRGDTRDERFAHMDRKVQSLGQTGLQATENDEW